MSIHILIVQCIAPIIYVVTYTRPLINYYYRSLRGWVALAEFAEFML